MLPSLTLCVLLLISSSYAQVPAEGLYITMRSDLLTEMFVDVGLQVADYANTDTTTPDASGTTTSVSYTFSSFVFDIDLEDPTFAEGGEGQLQVTYNKFRFIVAVTLI